MVPTRDIGALSAVMAHHRCIARGLKHILARHFTHPHGLNQRSGRLFARQRTVWAQRPRLCNRPRPLRSGTLVHPIIEDNRRNRRQDSSHRDTESCRIHSRRPRSNRAQRAPRPKAHHQLRRESKHHLIPSTRHRGGTRHRDSLHANGHHRRAFRREAQQLRVRPVQEMQLRPDF